jgi:hypothetical protein
MLAKQQGLLKNSKTVTMHVDRYTCNFCKNSMPNLMKYLELDELIVVSPDEITGALASTKYLKKSIKI